MKTRIVLFTLCLVGILAKAQSYTLNPGPVVNGIALPNDYSFFEIQMVNNGASPIVLEYSLLSNTLNPTWEVSGCDYQSCFPFVPTGRAMEPIASGEYGFLKLTLNPHSDPGLGQVVYKVWETSNPNVADTIIFNIDAVTATQPLSAKPLVAVYPNPTSDFIHIETGGPIHGDGAFMLYATDGKLVGKATMPSNGKLTYPVSDLPTGIYLVRVMDRDHDLMARIVIE
jgi:hypothetical protein